MNETSAHVRRNRERFPSHQLGAGEFGRDVQHAFVSLLSIAGLRPQQPGNPEVEQLHLAIGRYHYAGWFDAAVNRKLSMSVLHRLTDFQEQLQPIARGRQFFVQIPIEGPAFDQLRHDEHAAIIGFAGIDQSCDARMIE